MQKYFTPLLLAVFLFVPSLASAHQPRIVSGAEIEVTDPAISKAYYATLSGEQHIYTIKATTPFDLYVNVLVPDIAGQKKDVTALIFKDGVPLALLDGVNFEWKQFFEPFGHDTYWKGPEYKARADAGEYMIRVWSSNNDSKYTLAIGEQEVFSIGESMSTISDIVRLKRDFFNKSPIGFILSPIGLGYISTLYALAFIFGFIYRFGLKRWAQHSPRGIPKNIGKPDRLLRFAIALGLLLFAITTTWSPLLIFFSGFTLFEAIFSWCGLYAALGKNTCPV